MPESSIILKHLQIDEPDNKLLSILSEDKLSPPPFKQKTIDYEIALKIFREDPLSSFEKARLSELRRNGVHSESLEYKRWLYQDCKSRKMHFAQERAFKNNYRKKYGVNLEVLKFVNSFKQVSHDSLLKIGLSEKEILRYSEGIPTDNGKSSGRQKLLTKAILPNPRKDIPYYYITHKGVVSGRSFLKEMMKKAEINSRPQQRQDLLFHDLKVPECVLETQKMYEKKGWKLKEIKNESAQYSDIKKSVQNGDRKNGPAFMDAQMIFTKIEAGGSSNSPSKGKMTIVVGVEYGNYVNERMASKTENSIYDEAHVFSNERYMKQYQKQITTARIVTFHKI